MRNIKLLLLAAVLALGIPLAVQAPASAALCSGGGDACGRVTSGEFWHNLSGDYLTSGFENMCNCQAFDSSNWGGGEWIHYYYANNSTFSRNITMIMIHTDYRNGHNVITNYHNGMGGKTQVTTGNVDYHYPVGCTGTPC